MSLNYQVLSPNDFDEVFNFASERLQSQVADETERMFRSWSAKWRREALEHYLRLGWSFIVRDEKGVAGFFLAQPFLFFRGQTQTLWVEHVEARDAEVAASLADVAVRLAREKHLQRVLFAEAEHLTGALSRWTPSRLEEDIAEIKTTKG